MIQDYAKLQSLIQEYGRLVRQEGHTPQSRGQRFNHFIAEVLRCWGIRAVANIRSHGEIDIGFELEGRHFIVEAKWEQTPIDTGAIAKLQKRLRQRLGGTIGIFLSMSGFSAEALQDLREGEQLIVLCLNREHFEAMLSGFVTPHELINLLLAKASLFGEGYVPVKSLFNDSSADSLDLSFDTPQTLTNLVSDSIPNFTAKVVVSSLPFGQSGVAVVSSNQLLLTLGPGIFEVDVERKVFSRWLNIPQCSRNVVTDKDGTRYIVRKSGVARVESRSGQLTFVAGGFIGNLCLFEGINSTIWLFANGQDDMVSVIG